MNDQESEATLPRLDSLEAISEDEAMRLVSTAPVGRVAYTRYAMPAVHVVNFALDGRDPVFRTRKGAKFGAAVASTVVAFEVDSVDEQHHTGWTVTIVGRAELITAPAEIERLSALGITPWAGGERDHFIRVVTKIVNGRRIAPGPAG